MYSNGDVVIFAGARSPFGALNGALSSLKAHEISSYIIKHILDEYKINPTQITKLICGQVFTANQGQNPARQLALKSGLSKEITCYCINMLCGSGLKSIINAFIEIKYDERQVIIAGGHESMSQCPHLCNIRQPNKYGNATLVDSMINDGLMDAFNNIHMVETAEMIGKKFNIDRKVIDEYTLESIKKYYSAYKSKIFNREICPITLKNGKMVSEDEVTKTYSSIEELTKLNTVFNTTLMTSANCSSLNDGSAFVCMCEYSKCVEMGNTPLAKILGFSEIGNNPLEMGVAPIQSIQNTLEKCNLLINDIDLFEINDAFAVTSLAICNQLNIPLEKVNVNSGALVIGHPLGASGCRCLLTLIHNLHRLLNVSNEKTSALGMVALCIGGGMSVSVCIQVIKNQQKLH